MTKPNDPTGRPRRLLPAAVCLLAPFSWLLSGCGETNENNETAAESPGTPVAAVEIVRRDLSRELVTSATVQPRSTIRLAARTAGTVESVSFEEGETVEAGDVLVQLDTAESEAELERARAREEEALQEYRRAADLRQTHLISPSEYQRSQTELLVAESERKLQETRVAFGSVRAPRFAVVAARHIEPGEAVDARQVLFELITLDELVVQPGISERDVVHIETGQSVPVTLDALPGEEIEGTVRRIFPRADTGSRLVTVEIALPADAADRGVRPGYLARMRLVIDERPDVIAVPSSAIGEDGDSHYVYVINDDRLHHRTIERGVTRGQWTEVLSGLETGEIVLATNPIDMNDGDRVRIVGWRG